MKTMTPIRIHKSIVYCTTVNYISMATMRNKPIILFYQGVPFFVWSCSKTFKVQLVDCNKQKTNQSFFLSLLYVDPDKCLHTQLPWQKFAFSFSLQFLGEIIVFNWIYALLSYKYATNNSSTFLLPEIKELQTEQERKLVQRNMNQQNYCGN